MRSKILDFYPKKGIYSALKYSKIDALHHVVATPFKDINAYRVESGIQVSKGSMIDATIIPAPSSTKNKEKQRDPEMKSTRKNNPYFFGMKTHLGSDVNSNAIHSATVTSANVADIDEMPTLIREKVFLPKQIRALEAHCQRLE